MKSDTTSLKLRMLLKLLRCSHSNPGRIIQFLQYTQKLYIGVRCLVDTNIAD